MKTKITQINDNAVELEYDEVGTGERVVRVFTANRDGGYVRESIDNGRDYKQICNGLQKYGETLYLACGNSLLDLIRKEYKAMRKIEARG